MFTENEQNNIVYRGYNPDFVRQVLARRGQVALERIVSASDASSMADIVGAVSAQRGVAASDVCAGGKSNKHVAAARVEALRLIKEKLPSLSSTEVAAHFNQCPSGIRRIWRRLAQRQAA